jgi:hypothetical protein
MGNTFVQDHIGQNDLCLIDKDTSVVRDCHGKVLSTDSRHCGIAERRREDYVVLDQMVAQHGLQRALIRGRENGTDFLERQIRWNEKSDICDRRLVRAADIVASEDSQVGFDQSGIKTIVTISAQEEKSRHSERDDRVDFVDDDVRADHNVLQMSA